MTTPPRFLAIAAVKDEAAFLVEWVSWYRALGFEILVAYNDCTDTTPLILKTFEDAGWLTTAPHTPKLGEPPKRSAHRAARKHPAYARADWVLVCDVDEFLVLHEGDGTICGFIGDLEPDFTGLAFNWRVFGNSRLTLFEDTLVHRTFRRAAYSAHAINAQFKSIFRQPLRFRRLSEHAPVWFDGPWGQDGAVWVNSAGVELPYVDPTTGPCRRTRREDITHVNAQMNHYVIRWDEVFDLKRGKASASAGKDRYTDLFYKRHNRNGTVEESALGGARRFDPVHAEAMALPGMAALHHAGVAHLVERMCRHQGRAPEDDPRWVFHNEKGGH